MLIPVQVRGGKPKQKYDIPCCQDGHSGRPQPPVRLFINNVGQPPGIRFEYVPLHESEYGEQNGKENNKLKISFHGMVYQNPDGSASSDRCSTINANWIVREII